METTELLKKVRRIEIKTRGISNQIFSGSYHSAFKGRGMSFSEVREYQYGDDIRRIDWNVSARANKPFVKVFEEERELTVMLLIDMSRSAFFGTQTQMKNEIITEICAVLSFSAINNNDKVGILFFSDKVEKYIPPKKGKSHILRIIRELIDFEPTSSGTNLKEALQFFNNVIKKKSIAFLISDFMNSVNFKDALNIAGKRHDLVGIHLYDKRESELTDVGLARIVDAETQQELWLDTSDKNVRDSYAKWYSENYKNIKLTFGQSGCDLISIQTTESYITALLSMFKKRETRR